MGMTSIYCPNPIRDNYIKLTPNVPKLTYFDLCRTVDRGSRMDKCSIQALATSDVECTIWMSNFFNIPFDVEEAVDDVVRYQWTMPTLSTDTNGNSLNGMWFPCPSIPKFTIQSAIPFFQQYEFNDVARYILFQFIASQPTNDPLVPDNTGSSGSRVGLSCNITFR